MILTHSANTQEYLNVLILVEESEFQRVQARLNKVAMVGWQNVIDLQPIKTKKLKQSEIKQESDKNTGEIISKFDDKFFDYLIVPSDLLLDADRLEREEISVTRVGSVKTLFKKVEEILKKHNLHWHSHAMREWEKSSLKCANPDEWVQQFSELGHPQIAKHLLKILRVVTEAELQEAFKISEADRIGLNIAHAFFHDDEPGSSSIAIQNVLEHMYPPSEKVIKIDLTSEESLANVNTDVLFIYEDGLWSGVELINRLNAICKTRHFAQSNLQLHFKYGITSDVGLSAARLFSKNKKLNRLQFHPAKSSYHFKFLKDDIDNRFNHLSDQNDVAVREALDLAIEPYAFRSVEMWGDENEREKAISICAEIGKQLARLFLERKKVNIDDEEIAKLELGACRFASTIVFASSIPKPVLPLMWLQGRVNLDNKSVNWKPLFWDARRTGEAYTYPRPFQ